MNYYIAYNLCIASTIVLPELPLSNNNTADVTVKIGEVDLECSSNANIAGKNNVSGTLPGLAKTKIIDGKLIILEPFPGISESRLSPSIINGCMAVILRQRGYLTLHASSVVINNKLVAFIGNSGAGKSTLAAFFAEQGYRIVTDDVMAIEFEGGRCLVRPSYPLIKLRPNTVKALKCGENIYDESLGAKFSYPLVPAELNDMFPLSCIYALAIDNYHHIDSLTIQQGFVELVKNTRAMGLLKKDSFIYTHLEHCTKLIEKVKIRKFYRQPGFNEFPKLIKMIEEDC